MLFRPFRKVAVCLSLMGLAGTAATQAPTAAASATERLACTDFDTHVNARWLASTEIPASRSRIGSFDVLRMESDRLLATALPELAGDPARQTSPGLKLLATYYRSGMDTAAIERQGLAALKPWLARVDAATPADVPALFGQLQRLGAATPVVLFVTTDARDVTRHVLGVWPSGLGLPDRDDYTRSDEHTERTRAAYRRYAAALLGAAGAPAEAPAIDALIALETRIAAITPTRAERRDPVAQYNPMDPATLARRAPGLDWAALLGAYTTQADAVASLPLVVAHPAFLQALVAVVADTPIEAWRSYLRVRLLDAVADSGPVALNEARFDYRDRAIRGLQKPPSRAEQVILTIGGARGSEPLGQALGELYVGKAFSPQAQQRAMALVEDIRAAMGQRLAVMDWMSPATRTQALAKLDAMVAKIGAPARWRRYEELLLRDDDFLGNELRVAEWETGQRLADLGRPVDRTRWNTSPHIVNAFAAGGNQIVFPAAILQPPFFDADADDASNYGGIGIVIGHEIIHHFDDRGRQFDAVGNLRDWWQPPDAARYKALAERVAALYGSQEPVPGVRINGQLTLGENISDLGGMQLAFEALQIALKRQREQGKPPPLIDGQTPEQRFFTANAVVWRNKTRTEALVNELRTGSHSPGRWRILLPMAQMPAFAQAFGCKAGDAMVAAEPIRIW